MDEAMRRAIVLAEIEESERTKDEPLPDVEPTRPGRAASRVYTVRLAQDTVEELERVAAERDVPASALVRGFVLEGLASERQATVADAMATLQADLDRLRRTLGTAGAR